MKIIDTNNKELNELDFLEEKLKLWEKIYYPIYRAFNKVKKFPREIKWFIQRGKRGYADSDVWSIDFYLVDIIPKMIKELRNNERGIPSSMFSDVDDNTDEAWEIARKKWHKILADIIAAFLLMEKELDWETLTKEELKIRNKGVKLLYKHFYSLWY